MNHVYTVLQSDSNDVILRQVGANGTETFANLVCFISLILGYQSRFPNDMAMSPYLLPVSVHLVFDTVDSNG